MLHLFLQFIMEKRTQRFSLRKYSFGLASIVLGTVVLAFGANPVSADETANGTSSENIASAQPTTASQSESTSAGQPATSNVAEDSAKTQTETANASTT